MDANNTNEFARRRPLSWLNAPSPPSSDAPRDRRRPNNDLLRDPSSDILIDFNSQEGIYEAAKKKKGKTPQAPPSQPQPPAPPADDGQKDGNAGGDGGANNDDAAGDGAGDGKKNASGDTGWDDLMTASSKKKGVGSGLPTIPTNDFGTDSFDEIKLGDDKLDLGLRPPETKNSFGSWGTKWMPSGASWDWSGGSGGNDVTAAPAETKPGDNPWDSSKGADKSNTAFGSLEEAEGRPGKEDDWGFGAKKEKKQSSLWGAGPEEESKGGDLWGWGSSKKGKGDLLEEISMDSEPAAGANKKDIWDTWGISKKDRAKKKGIMEEAGTLVSDPAPEPPPADESWGGWSSKKDKTKKQNSLWGEQNQILEPAPDPPSFEDKEGDDFWSTFGTGKEKPAEEKPPAEGWASWALGKKETAKSGDDGWDLWGTGKKKKKAGDLIQLGDEIPPPAPDPVEAVGSGDFLDSWGFGSKIKKAIDPFSFQKSVAEEPKDEFWGSLGKKKPDPNDFLVEATGKIAQYDGVEGEGQLGDPEDAERAAKEAEGAQEDAEIAALLDKKAKKGGRLLKSDRERLAILEGNAATRAEARAAREAGEQGAKEAEEAAIAEATAGAAAQEAAEAEAAALREADEAEAARDDEEIATLTSKKKKRGKLLRKEQERLTLLEGNVARRAETRATLEAEAALAAEAAAADEVAAQEAVEAEATAQAAAEAEAAAAAAAAAAEIVKEEEEIKTLTSKKAKKGKLAKKDQDRLNVLNENTAKRAEEQAAKEADNTTDDTAAAEAAAAE
ncbi:hypothetical protein FZEAL_5777, partial [Fusarium zealandicum]